MTENYSITKCASTPRADQLPAFIYNRYDLWPAISDTCFSLWHYTSASEDFYYETLDKGKDIELGLWLVPASEKAFKHIVKHCFASYPQAKRIKLSNILNSLPGLSQTNHFRILLPATKDDLDSRLSSKGRYNIRREKRIIEEEMGEICLFEASANDKTAIPIWNSYFKFKEETYSTQYNLSPEEYCDKYHVTDIYALMAKNNDTPLAVILSCEQTPVVYLENLSYDPKYKKLSAGQVLYDLYLKKLIEKKVGEIYLLGGKYDYKKRYGSLEDAVYNGYYYRNSIMNHLIELYHSIKKLQS